MVSRVCKKVLTSLKKIALYISLITGLVGIGTVFHNTNRLHIHRRLPRESNITEWMTVSTDSELERINTLVMKRFSDDVEFFDPMLSVRNFTNVPRHNVCNNSIYLVTVHSRVNDTKTRNKWRHLYGTWQDEYKFRILFAIGNAETEEEQALIDQEIRIHGDILQADLIDTYRNITLKHLAVLRYVAVACPKVQAILKMDDDVAWNVEEASKLINTTIETGKIHCDYRSNHSVIRDPKNKWYVSYEEFMGNVYVPHCLGFAYTVPRQAILGILDVAHLERFFWVDDVLITGSLAHLAGVEHVPIAYRYSLYARGDTFVLGHIFTLVEQKDAERFYVIANSKWFVEKYVKMLE